MNSTHKTVLRSNYHPPAWWVDSVTLEFNLDPQRTVVESILHVRPNRAVNPYGVQPLMLYGEDVELLELLVNGQTPGDQLTEVAEGLLLHLPPVEEDATLTISLSVAQSPAQNSKLMGLYTSRGGLFTQCEAEGFRRITYFPDHPDVMSRYTVTLIADAAAYPVLLSNGNLVDDGKLSDGRHFAVWVDPFPKPSYLFALVAGKLVVNERQLTTQSGRAVRLQIWVEAEHLPHTEHAMNSLIKAIRWDEQRFQLELDLERFMIVAVADFNSGAMENKGLNIFNSKLLLATPETATDIDYENIEAVVAHEYFHNWTGNRVTCRDWFQLTLKEGLTVYRDQEFSADMLAEALAGESMPADVKKAAIASARAVKRIDVVKALRNAQFLEDSGPMAHPIRPESYEEIRNFYTSTVYEKGSEVIRMLATYLGVEGFAKGMALYFARHDGQAVTCDDFVAAMADANGFDARQFLHWYTQVGTPRITWQGDYDAAQKTFRLQLTQRPPLNSHGKPSYDQTLAIPVLCGLLDPAGKDCSFTWQGASHTTALLDFNESQQSWTFHDVAAEPVVSLFRWFSAPVIVETPETDANLRYRMMHDSDAFNRWDAGQRFVERTILNLVAEQGARPIADNESLNVTLSQQFLDAWAALLQDQHLSPAYLAQTLSLPTEIYLLQFIDHANPQILRKVLMSIQTQLGRHFADEWQSRYHKLDLQQHPYRYHPLDAGKRLLQNLCLRYLMAGNAARHQQTALAQLQNANNLTQSLAGLTALVQSNSSLTEQGLHYFYQRHQNNTLVLDKWFALQAMAWRWSNDAVPTLHKVRSLLAHPAFTLSNPNKVYALLGSFFRANAAEFHNADGYQFWAEQILAIDAVNSQVSARMARSMERWRSFAPELQAAAQPVLERVLNEKSLSSDVAEIIHKALD